MKSKEKTTNIECSYCHKQFKYESERKRHEQSHTPQFQCKVCKKRFSFLSALRRHEKQHDRVEDVWCEECNRKFRDETLLKRHMKYAHKGTFVCSKCNANFNSDVALRTHMKTHKPASERRFRCNFKDCNKSFNFPHHLKHHELTHTNTKQYFCGICSKGFIQLHHLKTHVKSHTLERLQCTVFGCNKKFTNEYARKRHLATHSNTIDSGISSSDSNSGCEISDMKVEGSSQCLCCGQMISEDQYEKHATICKDDIDESVHSSTKLQENSDVAVTKDLTAKTVKDVKHEVEDFRSCTAVLGGCIVSANGEVSDNCLCAQITPMVDDYEVPSNDMTKFNNEYQNINIDNTAAVQTENQCKGCDCSFNPVANTSITSKCDGPNACKSEDKLPELEYRIDGSIKIKETFDTDIDLDIVPFNDEIKKEVWPFNSCKTALGKCIASESGVGGDGCLCAKMAFVDTINAEEIDEITPRPTIY